MSSHWNPGRPGLRSLAGGVSSIDFPKIPSEPESGAPGAASTLREALRQFLAAPASAGLLASERAEASSLLKESETDLAVFSLLDLADRIEARGDFAAAGSLVAIASEFAADPSLSREIREKISSRLDKGAFGLQAEKILGQFLGHSLDAPSLAAMGVAGTVFRVARLGTLGKLLSRPTASWISRGTGARAIAAASGFLAETLAFTAAGRAFRFAGGTQQDWSAKVLAREWASGALGLGALRGFSALGTGVFQRVHGAAVGPWQGVYAQAAMLGGILVSHEAEAGLGWRESHGRLHSLWDGLATLLQFNVAGRLSRFALGPRWAAWEHQMDLAARALPASVLPGVKGGQFPFGPIFSTALPGGRPAASSSVRGIDFILSASSGGTARAGGRVSPELVTLLDRAVSESSRNPVTPHADQELPSVSDLHMVVLNPRRSAEDRTAACLMLHHIAAFSGHGMVYFMVPNSQASRYLASIRVNSAEILRLATERACIEARWHAQLRLPLPEANGIVNMFQLFHHNVDPAFRAQLREAILFLESDHGAALPNLRAEIRGLKASKEFSAYFAGETTPENPAAIEELVSDCLAEARRVSVPLMRLKFPFVERLLEIVEGERDYAPKERLAAALGLRHMAAVTGHGVELFAGDSALTRMLAGHRPQDSELPRALMERVLIAERRTADSGASNQAFVDLVGILTRDRYEKHLGKPGKNPVLVEAAAKALAELESFSLPDPCLTEVRRQVAAMREDPHCSGYFCGTSSARETSAGEVAGAAIVNGPEAADGPHSLSSRDLEAIFRVPTARAAGGGSAPGLAGIPLREAFQELWALKEPQEARDYAEALMAAHSDPEARRKIQEETAKRLGALEGEESLALRVRDVVSLAVAGDLEGIHRVLEGIDRAEDMARVRRRVLRDLSSDRASQPEEKEGLEQAFKLASSAISHWEELLASPVFVWEGQPTRCPEDQRWEWKIDGARLGLVPNRVEGRIRWRIEPHYDLFVDGKRVVAPEIYEASLTGKNETSKFWTDGSLRDGSKISFFFDGNHREFQVSLKDNALEMHRLTASRKGPAKPWNDEWSTPRTADLGGKWGFSPELGKLFETVRVDTMVDSRGGIGWTIDAMAFEGKVSVNGKEALLPVGSINEGDLLEIGSEKIMVRIRKETFPRLYLERMEGVAPSEGIHGRGRVAWPASPHIAELKKVEFKFHPEDGTWSIDRIPFEVPLYVNDRLAGKRDLRDGDEVRLNRTRMKVNIDPERPYLLRLVPLGEAGWARLRIRELLSVYSANAKTYGPMDWIRVTGKCTELLENLLQDEGMKYEDLRAAIPELTSQSATEAIASRISQDRRSKSEAGKPLQILRLFKAILDHVQQARG